MLAESLRFGDASRTQVLGGTNAIVGPSCSFVLRFEFFCSPGGLRPTTLRCGLPSQAKTLQSHIRQYKPWNKDYIVDRWRKLNSHFANQNQEHISALPDF